MKKIFHAITKEFPVGQKTEWFNEMKRLDRMGIENRVKKIHVNKNGKQVVRELLTVTK